MSRYTNKTLPELYLIASHRGIKGFFSKNKPEVIAMLEAADDMLDKEDGANAAETEETSQPKSKGKKQVAKKDKESKKKKKQDVDEEEVVEEEDEEVDVEEEEEEKPKKKSKRKDDVEEEEEEEEESDDETEEEEEEEEDEKDKFDKMDRSELKEFLSEEELGFKCKKAWSDDELRDEIRKAVKAKKKDDEEEEEAEEEDEPETHEKKKKKAKKSGEGKGRGKIEKDPSKTDNPFQAGTAGACVFDALKKGGTIEQIVERADRLIEKREAKPPADTRQKVNIIMKEVNSGKRGKWGKFVTSGKGKIAYEEDE